jgi:type II secretory pathway pseudopilin PulG
MKHSLRVTAAFSLVEITLAMGVAAFCLLAVLGMLPVALKTQQASVQQTTANSIISQIEGKLRAASRVPFGQEKRDDNKWILHPHTGGAWDPEPDVLYFTNDGNVVRLITDVPIYRATINYFQPPDPAYTTSLADITVSWPSQVDPADPTGVLKGKVETFIAINR